MSAANKIILFVLIQCALCNYSMATEKFRRIGSADIPHMEKPTTVEVLDEQIVLAFGQPSKDPKKIDITWAYHFVRDDGRKFSVYKPTGSYHLFIATEDTSDIGDFRIWFVSKVLSIPPYSNDSIVGRWKYVYRESQCEEYLNFLSNGSYYSVSSSETIHGKYINEFANGLPDRQRVTIYEIMDNGLADCRNIAQKSGKSFSVFVEIHGEKMSIYETADSTLSVADFHRVSNL